MRAERTNRDSGSILHAPTNIAGIAGLLAKAQRDLGYDATSVEYIKHQYGFGADRTLGLARNSSAFRKTARVGAFALGAIRRYDVFHLYFGNTLFPHPYPDLRVLRALGKRIVFHFCGCDVRGRATTLDTYTVSGCHECVSLVCLGKRHPDPALADVALVSTPDLIEFVPGARLMPGPIDLERWIPGPSRTEPVSAENPVRILHAPSDREIKGTRHLLDAVERLKSAGYPVELLMLEGVPHSDVVHFCGLADIAVDQLMIGAYGTVSIEMMAKGVPVVCRIRDDLRPYYPADLPLLSAGPDDVYDVLERLLSAPKRWADLGTRGIEYVTREHEMHRVARKVLDLYGTEYADDSHTHGTVQIEHEQMKVSASPT
ncbi:MAG: glycosyltransferase [Chloroflexota bacterium]|nr:glycosyltransferase [Chloroflexota bacterium]